MEYTCCVFFLPVFFTRQPPPSKATCSPCALGLNKCLDSLRNVRHAVSKVDRTSKTTVRRFIRSGYLRLRHCTIFGYRRIGSTTCPVSQLYFRRLNQIIFSFFYVYIRYIIFNRLVLSTSFPVFSRRLSAHLGTPFSVWKSICDRRRFEFTCERAGLFLRSCSTVSGRVIGQISSARR